MSRRTGAVVLRCCRCVPSAPFRCCNNALAQLLKPLLGVAQSFFLFPFLFLFILCKTTLIVLYHNVRSSVPWHASSAPARLWPAPTAPWLRLPAPASSRLRHAPSTAPGLRHASPASSWLWSPTPRLWQASSASSLSLVKKHQRAFLFFSHFFNPIIIPRHLFFTCPSVQLCDSFFLSFFLSSFFSRVFC